MVEHASDIDESEMMCVALDAMMLAGICHIHGGPELFGIVVFGQEL